MEPLELLGAVGTVLTVVSLLVWLVRSAARTGKSLADFKDDLLGESARPGVAERPGVMQRLASIEQAQAGIVAELHPNGGSSLRDAVNRTEVAVATLDGRLSAVETGLAAVQAEHARHPVTVNVSSAPPSTP